MIRSSAVVLFSGGQDSTTCLFWARNGFDDVFALSFDYGQRHADELLAAGDIARQAGVPHDILELSVLAQLGDSALLATSSRKLQSSGGLDDDEVAGGLPTSFVPGRNLLFLGAAAAYAVKKGSSDLVVGFSEADFSGYPDCRQVFIEKMVMALEAAMPSSTLPWTIHAPLLKKTKKETVLFALLLGDDCWKALERSVTCYRGERPGCGECPACKLRARGFEEAGLKDPAQAYVPVEFGVPDPARPLSPEDLKKARRITKEEVEEALRNGADDPRGKDEP